MEVGLLSVEVGNLGIDADDRIGELIHAGERVDKAVAAYGDIAAGASFVPAVAVATEEDGRTRSVVEKVVLHHRALGCAEERSAGTVVADGVMGKVYLGSPGEVLYTIACGGANLGRQRIGKADDELLGTVAHAMILTLIAFGELRNLGNRGYEGFLIAHQLHGLRTYKLHLVAHVAPVEAPSLRVHVAPLEGVVIDAFHHLEVGAVHVNGIVHHRLVESVHRYNLALAAREVGGIGLCGEVARVVIATQTYAEAIERDILAHLRQ